ncbi:putative transcription factor lepB [Lachnellula suecica]|uniref:Putative transcription factor lepB n=1 Tax=Lachnellula suecica TaxID=602035 RepID=A0A8T9CIZ6_9HELO|nr:putative transcription factor lepB [Lachnellula suecica]
MHIPTTRAMMKTFYLRLNQGESVLPGQAALLLSIFALAAYFYPSSDNSEVTTSEQDSVHLSKLLSKSALDVLDHSRRNTSGTLEDIQAYMLMSFTIFHLDGFSARGRMMTTAAIAISRDLILHRLDDVAVGKQTSIADLVDREVKRRVFWMLASSDWLASTISGPQEGMYFIHPNHINVRIPKNCDDDDLVAVLSEDRDPVVGPEPTGMSNFLERLRLAQLCREMFDILPLETSKLNEIPYENIIAFDQRIVDFISTLPVFFRLDAESRRQTKPMEAMYPNIPLLRYCITRAAYSRRCKLHQRFLLRKSTDPRYAYSRQACIESARAVISFYDGLAGDSSPVIVTAQMGIAVHFMHLALVVLVMDLCFNRGEADEALIKAEVRAGLQVFEDTKHISPLLGQFLSSLRHTLQKHKVYLNDPLAPTGKGFVSVDEGNSDTFNSSADDTMDFVQHEISGNGLDIALDPSFDEFWQTAMQSEPNLDLEAWDNLFSALDTRPL